MYTTILGVFSLENTPKMVVYINTSRNGLFWYSAPPDFPSVLAVRRPSSLCSSLLSIIARFRLRIFRRYRVWIDRNELLPLPLEQVGDGLDILPRIGGADRVKLRC